MLFRGLINGFFLIFLVSTVLYSGTNNKKTILSCRPVDVGTSQTTTKNHWLIALIDRQVRFRLTPLNGIELTNDVELIKLLPAVYDYTIKISDDDFFLLAPKLAATHLLLQKFELIEHEKVVNYYAEIVEPGSKRVVTQIEKDIPIEQISLGIDSCLLILLPKFGVPLSNDAVRFLSLPITGTSLRSIKALGELFCKEGDTVNDRAALSDEYEKLIKKDPFMLLANYSVGMLNFNRGNYGKSSKYIKELLNVTPIYTSLYLTLARSYRLEERYNEALSIALLCERNRLKTIPYLIEKALALEGLKQQGAAFSTHQQILLLDQAQPVSLLFMARLQNDERNYTKGKLFAEKLLTHDRNNSDGYFEMGRSLFGLGKFKEAQRALSYAEQLQPKNAFIQEYLGDISMIHNVPDSAYIHYQRAVSIRPLELDLFLKSSKALETSGKKKDALLSLYAIVGRFPSKPLLRRQIGLLEYATGQLDSATRSLSMYLATKPGDSHVLQITGNAFLQSGNYRKAKDFFEKALPLVDDKITCKLLLAEAELQLQNQPVAMRLLHEIIAEKPVKNAHKMLGDAILLAGSKQEALKEYRKERELHGATAPLQEKIAQLHYDLGFTAPAKKEFEQLIKLNPLHAGAFYHLSLLSLQSGNTSLGGNYFDKAQQLGPGSAEIFYKAGNLFNKNRSTARAIAAYIQCTTLQPEHEQALSELSDAYLSQHNDTAAAEINVRLFRINNKVHAPRLAQAGHLYLKNGQEKAAASAYQLFLEKGFSDFSVNTGYAGIAYKANDFNRVISLLKDISGDFAKNEANLLSLSDAYCRTGQHAKALPWLVKLRQMTTSNRLEARLSAQASEMTGDTITAIAMYSRLLGFPADSLHRNEAYHLGTLYEKKNMIENAISRFELNTKENPDDLRSHEQLGKLYMQRKDGNNALRILETAVKYPHVNAATQKMLAQTYAATGNPARAAEYFTIYLSRTPEDVGSWKELADIYFRQNKFQEAVEPLKKVTGLQPDNFEAWYKLGASLIAAENFTAAIAPLGRARALQPKDIPAIELSARCYRHMNETSTLKTILREWIALDPRRYDIKMEIGSILISEKEIDEAIAMLMEAVRFIPSEAKPHVLLAKAYELQSNDSLRFVHLLTALRFEPEAWETHYQLARYYLSNGLGHDAETHFKKAISLYPANDKIHYEYGLFLMVRNEFNAAHMEFGFAHEVEPENALYQSLLAFTECMLGNRATAMELTTAALKRAPNDAHVLYWAGRIYKETGRIPMARESFSNALSLDSNCAPCLEALGDIYMGEIMFKEAANHYFRSWDRGGYNPNRVYKLGNALFYDRKFKEAKDFFETILTKSNKFDDARYRLTAAYCELGEMQKAHEQIPLFIGSGSPWMQLAQGYIYEHENNLKAALAAYSIAKNIAPDHPDVFAGIGRVYIMQEEYDSAVLYLSTASAADTLNMQAMIDLGNAFEHLGDLSSAVQYYIEVDKKYPVYPDVQLRIAGIKSSQKAHETAIRLLERGIEFHPEDTALYYMLGQEYVSSSKYKDAINAFKKALKIGKGRPIDALRSIGNVYYDYLAEPKKAKDFYKKYVKAGGAKKEAIDRLAEN